MRAPPESKPCRESRRIQPRRGEGPETRTSGRSNIQTQSFDIVLFNEVLLSLFLQRATPFIIIVIIIVISPSLPRVRRPYGLSVIYGIISHSGRRCHDDHDGGGASGVDETW